MLTHSDLEYRKHIRNNYKQVLSASAATYSAGDQVGEMFEIKQSATQEGPIKEPNLSAILQSLAIVDLAKQSADIDLFFFDEQPTGGVFADKTAFSPTSDDMLKCIGVVSILTAEYVNAGGNIQIASKANIGRVLKPSAAANGSLWCIAVTRDTPTYTASCLKLNLQFSHGL